MVKTFVLVIQFTIVIFIALALGLSIGYFRTVNDHRTGDQTVDFTVKPGEGPKVIADGLATANLIQGSRSFLLYVLFTGNRDRFRPGTYTVKRSDSIVDLVQILTDQKSQNKSVTIIEGSRITDIATELAKKTPIKAADFLSIADPAQYEGYLFPDTYTFAPDVTAAQVVQIMRNNFDKRTADLNLTRQDIIIASIIEREAKTATDRAVIAGVYLNRLKAGMPLEADPTVQYAKGSWAPITLADYHSVLSPYNTYLHIGLPPTPICNPSLVSLNAATNPTPSDYYYFFTTGSGQTIYSKTLAEHNANKQKYLYK